MASARSDSSSASLSASARIAALAFRRAASIRADRTATDTAVPSLVKTSSAFDVSSSGRGVVELRLRASCRAELPSWSPGAHIDLEFSPGLIRQYSMCGRQEDRSVWTIAVLREPDGRSGSRHVHDVVREGSKVRVLAMRNLFEMQPASRYICIAGGFGITPIIPMVESAERSSIPWELHYGGRSARSMVFIDALRMAYGDKVVVWPEDANGLLDLETILREPVAGVLVYCCGPPGLICAVEERCKSWPAESLHIERFTAASPGIGDADAPFDVIVQSSPLRVTVPPDRSVVEVLRDHEFDVVTGCEQGICGTCVLDGIPDHRDHVLTEDERRLNTTMMVCVSRAKSAGLTLGFA
jgi:ferredoxin-NADP reductase